MSVFGLVVIALFIILALYCINVYVADTRIRAVFNIVVALILILFLAQLLGLVGPLTERIR
jgi:hypothetical protein